MLGSIFEFCMLFAIVLLGYIADRGRRLSLNRLIIIILILLIFFLTSLMQISNPKLSLLYFFLYSLLFFIFIYFLLVDLIGNIDLCSKRIIVISIILFFVWSLIKKYIQLFGGLSFNG